MIMMTSKQVTMSKDIKDYLHLYLGCEVYNPTYPMWRFRLVAISGVEAGKNIRLEVIIDEQEGPYPDTGWCWPERLKLILRSLSDMTEEEMKQVAWLQFNYKAEDVRGKDRHGNIKVVNKSPFYYWINPIRNTNPETTLYLLSKHFDLFGLIEAGIALDKTTLK